jgi:nitric oxide dioxygenase
MNLPQIALVQTTFARIKADENLFAAQLYDHLFRLDPCTCYLFPRDMTAHREKFMAVLTEIVAGLERPFPLIQIILKPLGRRHADYGIRPQHYHTFAAAFRNALADILGEMLTVEVECAWMEAFYLVVGIIKEMSHSHQPIKEVNK